MGRGIRLACESCDYAAEMAERAPFRRDAAGTPRATAPDDPTPPDGYWADWLCGSCRLPQREVAAPATDSATPEADDAAVPAPSPTCAHCGEPLLPFAVALTELAEASRSRVWLDLATERVALDRLEHAARRLVDLEDERAAGELTTQAALDALVGELHASSDTGDPVPDVTTTAALTGLDRAVENAADLDHAAHLVVDRIGASRKHIGILEKWCAEEAELPGVPCPKCQTGQLLHWPVWD